MDTWFTPPVGSADGRTTTSRVRRTLRPVAAFGAAAALLAAVAGVSSVAAAEPNPDCDGVSWSASVAAGENPYPMLTVTVKFDGDPGACSLAFSMASYDTEGPTWPTSGHQSFLDFDTATIDAANPSATLSVAEPDCFGQTDFYLGSTKYDGVDGPLPHYPDVPAPFDKISGSEGGHACEAVQPPPAPKATPTEQPAPTDLGVGGTEPTATATETNVDLAAGGGGGNITPPPTDTAPAATGQTSEESLVLLLVALGGFIGFSLLTPARLRRMTRR